MIAMCVTIGLFILILIWRVLFGVFVDKVAWFADFLVPLNWLLIGAGVLMATFIIIRVIKEIKKK